MLCVVSAHLLTYSAAIQSVDTLRVFDAASSLARYGDVRRDESLSLEPPEILPDPSRSDYPIIPYEQGEPLVIWAASQFYRLGDSLGLGLAHSTWLLNIVVSLGVVWLFYHYARALQYHLWTALLGAAALGLATGVWVYSKTLFREPLVMLLLLLGAYSLERWRQQGVVRGGHFALVGGLAFVGAYFSKNSALLALPALLLIPLPLPWDRRAVRRLTDGMLLLGGLLLTLLAFSPAAFDALAIPVLERVGFRPAVLEFTQTALHSYLFSVGGSLWGTSPVLLLAIPGVLLALRRGQRRLVWVAGLAVAGYAVGHALLTDAHWFGGVSWPPRFLIPVLPFAMLGVLPALEWLVTARRAYLWYALAIVLVLYSVGIQIIGALSFVVGYGALLPPEAGGLYEWGGGLNQVAYLRWVLLPQAWAQLGLDVAWARIGMPVFALAYVLVIGFALLGAAFHKRRSGQAAFVLAVVLLLGNTSVYLATLREDDPLFWAHKPQLQEVLQIVSDQAADGEPLVLADETYQRFILNYFDLDHVRPIVLGFQPGEAASESEPPRVRTDFPPQMLDLVAPRALDFLALQHERLWLLAHNSVYIPWAVRPVERYLTETYYPLREFTTDDPTVRLLEYSAVLAPDRYGFRLPEHLTDLRYGGVMHLMGVTLPSGTNYVPGEVVPITLVWTTDAALTEDYIVAWFIAEENGAFPPIQGWDSMPNGGFAPTSTWQPGEIVFDNRAIELPAETPAGAYNVWVLVYPAGGDSTRLEARGATVLEGTVGVLPLQLSVRPE